MKITLEDGTPIELASDSDLVAVLTKSGNRRRLLNILNTLHEAEQSDGGFLTAIHEPFGEDDGETTFDLHLSMIESQRLPDGSIEASLDLSMLTVRKIDIGWQVAVDTPVLST